VTITDPKTGKVATISVPKFVEKQAIERLNTAFATLGSTLRAG
jgi:hypothetical protein